MSPTSTRNTDRRKYRHKDLDCRLCPFLIRLCLDYPVLRRTTLALRSMPTHLHRARAEEPLSVAVLEATFLERFGTAISSAAAPADRGRRPLLSLARRPLPRKHLRFQYRVRRRLASLLCTWLSNRSRSSASLFRTARTHPRVFTMADWSIPPGISSQGGGMSEVVFPPIAYLSDVQSWKYLPGGGGGA